MSHLIMLNDIEALIVIKALKYLKKKRFATSLDKTVADEVIEKLNEKRERK